MNIQDIATKARQSISTYCVEECKAYCCRKGFLILNEEEALLLTQRTKTELIKLEYITQQKDKTYSLNFTNQLGGCPQLEGSLCKIHTHPKRPKTCKTFPIFINEDTKEIRLSPRCFAVKENKLYPFIHIFLKLGYTINNVEF